MARRSSGERVLDATCSLRPGLLLIWKNFSDGARPRSLAGHLPQAVKCHNSGNTEVVMAARHRFSAFIVVAISLMFLAGCGGGGRSLSFPPPTGTFTNASLNGPFAFSYTGSDGGGFLAVAGSFQADGSGHITSGMQDINSGFGIITNSPI